MPLIALGTSRDSADSLQKDAQVTGDTGFLGGRETGWLGTGERTCTDTFLT